MRYPEFQIPEPGGAMSSHQVARLKRRVDQLHHEKSRGMDSEQFFFV